VTAQPSAFGAREPVDIRAAASVRRQSQGLLQQLRQREQQQAQAESLPPEPEPAPRAEPAPRVQASTPQPPAARPAPQVPVNPLAGRPSSPPAWPERPGGPTGPRRIFGIQPVLFVGICLLAIVTIITVVLIFVGDFESQASRVVWTVVVFLAFTGLLALDLVLARRSATPLVIGVAANIYLLAVLMISIWMRGAGDADDRWVDGWLFGELLGIVLLTVLVVRAAAAAAWGLIVMGDRGHAKMARIIGLIAAALVGVVAVLLTLHFAIDAFGFEVDEWYWRSTVAAIVVTALASSVTVLLFWNRRNIDWQEAEARGEHARPARRPAPRVQQAPAPAPWQAPPPAPAPWQAPPPAPQPAPQPDANGLLPWPTYPDGTPYPVGRDGQPVFPPGVR
jgi:hypothetical protein